MESAIYCSKLDQSSVETKLTSKGP
jgi:hypothetical protein